MKDKQSVYDEVTQRIVAAIESGVMPWQRPWDKSRCGRTGVPRNAVTGRAYNGVNVLLLWMFGPPGEPIYLTYLQGQKIGAQVREGEKGFRVVYADQHIKKDRAPDGTEEIVSAYSFLKRYTVFHPSQFDNMPAKYAALGEPIPPLPHPEFVRFVERTGARVTIGGDRCCYHRSLDGINMPPWTAFAEQSEYMACMLHELVHWSGAPHRLDRQKGKSYESVTYAREELIAEIGSAFLCAHLGVVGKTSHSEYIGHWLKMLKNDNREIFRVAAAAQRACDYLLQLAGANQLQAAE